MPTYTVHSMAGRISADQRQTLARRIAEVHSQCTGAPMGFAQCIFRESEEGEHFIGGQPAPPETVWILGQIRGGRTRSVKDRLLSAILGSTTELLGVPASAVWIYLSELDHQDMVEFGRALPADGGEAEWLQALPPDIHSQIVSYGPDE